jgi:NAD(P)-dependent dehydrogenase (short-subunit alcohol dehydrogenase family)
MKQQWTIENIPDLTGKVAIVTGANRGIGFALAQALSLKRATVILACRNKDKGEDAAKRIQAEQPDAKDDFIRLDLSDLTTVKTFTEEFKGRYDRLDMLINNAGIMQVPYGKTAEGFELQFCTNHLGHFLLTGFLLDSLMHTPMSRVITMSSGGHRFGKIDFDNLNAEKGYDRGKAYGQSKLANLLFTYELQRKFEDHHVNAIACAAHPGWTATDLAEHWPMVKMLNPLIGQTMIMGALPALYAATAPGVKGGEYFGPNGWLELRGYPAKVKSSPTSYDKNLAARLWTVSEKLTGIKYKWPA